MSSPTTLSPHAGIGGFGHYPHSDLDRRAVEGMTTSASAASIESLLVNPGQSYYHMDQAAGPNGQYVPGAQFDYPDSYRRRMPTNDIFAGGAEAAKRSSVDGATYHAEQYIAPRDLGVAAAQPSYYQSFGAPHTSAATYSPRSAPTAPQGSPQYSQASSWGQGATAPEEIQRSVNYYPQVQQSSPSHETHRLSDPGWTYSAGTYGNSHAMPAIDGQIGRGVPPVSGMNYSSIAAHSGAPMGSPPSQYSTSRATGAAQAEESARSKPQCWQHGCNGRQFSTFSNLLRHQRERAGTAAKSSCPRCGAEFTRTTARNGHMLHAKCRPRRSPESS